MIGARIKGAEIHVSWRQRDAAAALGWRTGGPRGRVGAAEAPARPPPGSWPPGRWGGGVRQTREGAWVCVRAFGARRSSQKKGVGEGCLRWHTISLRLRARPSHVHGWWLVSQAELSAHLPTWSSRIANSHPLLCSSHRWLPLPLLLPRCCCCRAAAAATATCWRHCCLLAPHTSNMHTVSDKAQAGTQART
jgi:hypothetical protein